MWILTLYVSVLLHVDKSTDCCFQIYFQILISLQMDILSRMLSYFSQAPILSKAVWQGLEL